MKRANHLLTALMALFLWAGLAQGQSTVTERIGGVSASLAVKAPAKAATTANITLSGLQTVDGVALATGDRVLVKDQTTATQNGIYQANTSTWTRAADFDGGRDVAKGTSVLVTDGTANANTYWRVSASNPITIDTTSITFAQATVNDSATLAFTQAGAGAVTRTAQDKMRDAVSAKDFGAVCDGASHQLSGTYSTLAAAQAQYSFVTSLSQELDYAAIQAAVNTGKTVYLPTGLTGALTCILGTTGISFSHSNQRLYGNHAVISYSGTVDAIGFDLETATVYPQYVHLEDLTVAISGSGATGIRWRSSFGTTRNVTVYTQGGGVAQTAWRLWDSATTQTQVYYAVFENSHVVCDGASDHTAWLFNEAVGTYGPNANTWIGGNVTGCRLNWVVRGQNNTFINTLSQATQASGISFSIGGASAYTTIINAYLETPNAATGYAIGALATDTTIIGGYGSGYGGGTFYVDLGTRTQYLRNGELKVPKINFGGSDLSYYAEGSFTGTLTGCTATVTGTVYYTRIGNQVTLDVPALTCTSNTTAKTITGMPSSLQPTSTKRGILSVQDNGGTYQTGQFAIVGGGTTITLTATPASGAWTAANTMSVRDFSATYTLQ